MPQAQYRISIGSFAGTFIRPENDAAAGALMLGATRAVVAAKVKCTALYLGRKAVILEVVDEPDADLLQALQVLGDTYENATTAKQQEHFEPRVRVESLTTLPSAETSAVLLAAKLAFDAPGTHVTRQVPGGAVRVTFEPEDGPGADPTN